MPTLAIIGSIVTDIVVKTPRLPGSGENLHVPKIEFMTGGKAANAAVAWKRLGGHAYLFGNTGADHFGRQARQVLQREGVDISAVMEDENAPTGRGILLVEPDGQTAFLIEPGANQTLTPSQLETHLRPLLGDLDGLLLNFESPEACLLLASELAHGRGIPLYVDAGPGRPYDPAIWRRARILTPNAAETATLVGFEVTDLASARAAAQELLARGPEAVVLKLGRDGALVATCDRLQLINAFAVKVVDTAGAGDAFTAGMIYALHKGQSLPDAVVYANACGAIAASRLGTLSAMPWSAEVGRFLEARG